MTVQTHILLIQFESSQKVFLTDELETPVLSVARFEIRNADYLFCGGAQSRIGEMK